MSVSHIISGTTITVVVDMVPKAIAFSHPNYERIKTLAADPDSTEADIRPLLDIPQAIKTYTDGKVYVKNGKLYLDGTEVRTSLAAKIMEFVRTGDTALAEPLKLFLANVAQNPDPRAQIDLFDWLQSAKLPITSDGHILAWKAVNNDYRSIAAPNDPRFNHRIGNRVEQSRDECDANPDVTCSQGLHFCAASYLSHYASGGNRIVVVKIHPKDVVAFPRDYNLAKGRACGYDVVGEVPYDKVKDYYPQGRPVYTGFDAPKPAGVKAEVGKVYRRRDGSSCVIVREGNNGGGPVAYAHDDKAYWADTGRGHKNVERPYDLVREIEFPLSVGDFHAGDRWVTREGKTITITELRDGLVYCDGRPTVYTRHGRAYSSGKNNAVDLVFNLDHGRTRAEIVKQLDLKDGDVVRTRSGAQVTVTASEGGICKTTGYVFTKTGVCADTKVGERLAYANSQDVVEIISRAPVGVGPLNLVIGDEWLLANGQRVTITQVGTHGTYPVKLSNGSEVTLDGHYYSDGRTSAADLHRKV